MAKIVGSRAVEDAAIAWVLARERSAGREPSDTRGKGAAADIESPPRVIEVKAYSKPARGQGLWLDVRQFEEATRNSDFWISIVENVGQGDPASFTLKELGGERLKKLLARAKEQHYYTGP